MRRALPLDSALAFGVQHGPSGDEDNGHSLNNPEHRASACAAKLTGSHAGCAVVVEIRELRRGFDIDALPVAQILVKSREYKA